MIGLFGFVGLVFTVLFAWRLHSLSESEVRPWVSIRAKPIELYQEDNLVQFLTEVKTINTGRTPAINIMIKTIVFPKTDDIELTQQTLDRFYNKCAAENPISDSILPGVEITRVQRASDAIDRLFVTEGSTTRLLAVLGVSVVYKGPDNKPHQTARSYTVEPLNLTFQNPGQIRLDSLPLQQWRLSFDTFGKGRST